MLKKSISFLLALTMILGMMSVSVYADGSTELAESWSDGGFLWQTNQPAGSVLTWSGNYPVGGRYINFQTDLWNSSLTLWLQSDETKMVFGKDAEIPDESVVYSNTKDSDGNYSTVLGSFKIDKINGVIRDSGENPRSLRFQSYGQNAFLNLSDTNFNSEANKSRIRTVGIRFMARGETEGTTIEWVSSGSPSGNEVPLTSEYKEYVFTKTFAAGEKVNNWFDVNRGHAAFIKNIEVCEVVAPTASAVYNADGTVTVTFSNSMDDSALNIHNYTVSDAVISKVEKLADKQYTLSFASPLSAGEHTVTIQNVKDLYGLSLPADFTSSVTVENPITFETAWTSKDGLKGQVNMGADGAYGSYKMPGRYLNFQTDLWHSSLTVRDYDDDSIYLFTDNTSVAIPEKSIVYSSDNSSIINEMTIAEGKWRRAGYADNRGFRYEKFSDNAYLNLTDINLNNAVNKTRKRTVGIRFKARGETDGTTLEWLYNGRSNGNAITLTNDYKEYVFARTFNANTTFTNWFDVNIGHAAYIKDIEVCELGDTVLMSSTPDYGSEIGECGSIELTFNSNIKTAGDIMDKITLNGESAFDIIDDVTVSGKTLTITFMDSLDYGDYTVSAEGITDEYGVAVMPFDVSFSVSTDKILLDKTRIKAGETVKARIPKYTNDTPYTMSPILVVALYKDNTLENISLKPVTLTSNESASEITASCVIPSNLDDGVYTLKAMFWSDEGVAAMKPLKKYIEITE